jgi:hypothetical protein
LYETELIALSSSVVVSSRNENEEHKRHGLRMPVNITLDVPSFHYYPTVDEELEQGLCTASEALEWVDAIEKRHDQISRVFEKTVRHELEKRGVTTRDCVEIHLSPTTNVVSTSIHQALKSGHRASLVAVLQKLLSSDGAWRDFFKLLISKQKPKTFQSLGYLFYAF